MSGPCNIEYLLGLHGLHNPVRKYEDAYNVVLNPHDSIQSSILGDVFLTHDIKNGVVIKWSAAQKEDFSGITQDFKDQDIEIIS